MHPTPSSNFCLPEYFTVGLDPDGAILDGLKQKTLIARELYGVEIEPCDCKRDIIVTQKAILTLDQYEQIKEIGYNDRDWALRFEFIPGSRLAIQRFAQLGFRTPVITRRHQRAAGFIQELFNQEGLGNLEVSSTESSQDKWPIIESLGGVHVFVDDDLEILEHLRGKIPYLILFAQPYNGHQQPDRHIRKASSWDEVERLVILVAQAFGYVNASPAMVEHAKAQLAQGTLVSVA